MIMRIIKGILPYIVIALIMIGYFSIFGVPVDEVPDEYNGDLQELLEKDHFAAKRNMGDFYFVGASGVPQSYENALECYISSANAGDDYAQYMAGRCFMEGKGVPQNYNEGMRWLLRSAEAGNVYAQTYLGRCYELGIEEIAPDREKAVQMYRSAASCGYDEAAKALSLMGETID